MDHALIETFLAIANSSSMSEAAECLHLAQSSVSHRLKNLESELGIQLIERTRGNNITQLSTMGKQFLPIAKRWLEIYQDAISLKQNDIAINLSIGFVESLGFVIVPAGKQLLKINRNNSLYLTALPTELIYQRVQSGHLNVGIVTRDMNVDHIKVISFYNENYKLIRYTQSPKRIYQEVSLKELNPSQEVFHPWGGNFLKWHEDRFPDNKYYIRFNNFTYLKLFMEEADGNWSIVPESVAELFADMDDYQITLIDEHPPTRTTYFIKSEFNSPETEYCISKFTGMVMDYYNNWKAKRIIMTQESYNAGYFIGYKAK